jgi:GPI ethanolamine phosphate transferase 1
MARYSRRVVLFLGIIFHLVQLGSIFDIYFVTPLVHGMRHFRADVQPPAKRFFLVVGTSPERPLEGFACFRWARWLVG